MIDKNDTDIYDIRERIGRRSDLVSTNMYELWNKIWDSKKHPWGTAGYVGNRECTIPFYDYILRIEGFLEEEYQMSIEFLKRRFDSQNDYEENGGALAHDLIEQTEEFRNILRRSFFVTVYGFLESCLINRCRDGLLQRKDILLSLGDINGQGIYLAQTCLKKVLQVSFDDTSPRWFAIKNYQKLRNCIIHNQSRLKGSRDETHLRKYISERTPLLAISQDDEIVISLDFCKEILDTITLYLQPDFDV